MGERAGSYTQPRAHATRKVAVYQNEVRGAVSIASLVEIETPYPVLFSGQPSTPMAGLRCAPRSTALLAAWQSWHSGCRLLMASEPPCCSGTMWSTSLAALSRPSCKQLMHRGSLQELSMKLFAQPSERIFQVCNRSAAANLRGAPVTPR